MAAVKDHTEGRSLKAKADLSAWPGGGGQCTYISYLGPHNAGRLITCPTGVLYARLTSILNYSMSVPLQYAHALPQSWTSPCLYLSNIRTPYLNPDSPYRYVCLQRFSNNTGESSTCLPYLLLHRLPWATNNATGWSMLWTVAITLYIHIIYW